MTRFQLVFTLFPILVCGFVTAYWFFFRSKKLPVCIVSQVQEENNRLDLLVVLLCFIAIFIFPIRIRSLLINRVINHYGNFNFLCALAVLISLFRLRRWTLAELICFCLWYLLLIPMVFSNDSLKPHVRIVAVSQSLLPLLLVLYPMNVVSRKKAISWFVILYNVFIGILLTCGILERFFDRVIFHTIINILEANGLNASSFTRTLNDNRFYSLWGHPLSNAVFFNSFFVLNTFWLRVNRRKCPTLVFFLIALTGVLLASSKTGIIVCFLLQIIINWKYKKWLLISIPVLVTLYFLGGFNAIITRFSTSSLSSGRIETFQKYLATGLDPFRFFSGYGSNVILNSSHPLSRFRAAFEMPLLMFAHDYGILFSMIHIIGLFIYTSWRFLQNKNWLPWLCWSLLFAEVNTFNAYTLRSQDDCWFFCLMTLVLLSITEHAKSEISIAENIYP